MTVCLLTGLDKVEEAYQDEKQRGHNETVDIADRQNSERGKAEAEYAKSGSNDSSSRSNGNGSSGNANGTGKVRRPGPASYPLLLQEARCPEQSIKG